MQRRGLLVKDKKGLSDVVTSVLLILLVLAGIAIMWVVIRQFIVGTTSQLSSSALTASFTILPGATDTVVNGQIKDLKFNVRRDQGGSEARVSTLKIVLRDSTGRETSQDWSVPGGSFKELETLPVSITPSSVLTGKITSVKVQPVLILPDGTTQAGTLSTEQQLQDADHLVLDKILAWYSFDEVDAWTVGSPTVTDNLGVYTATPRYGTSGSVAQDKNQYIFGGSSARFVPSTVQAQGPAYVELPSPTAGQGLDSVANGISFVAWVRPEDLTAQTLIASSGGTPGTGYNVGMNVRAPGSPGQTALDVAACASGVQPCTDATTGTGFNAAWRESNKGAWLDVNRWSFVVVTMAPNGASCNVYVDGRDIGFAAGDCPALSVQGSANQHKRLGALLTASTCNTPTCRQNTFFYDYKGYMDEVMVFSKVLGQDEVSSIYNYFNKRRPN